MPKRKIKAKPEDYIPLHPDDVKHSLEIPVKQIDKKSLVKIEKQGKKPAEEKYTLIITEKPQAALKIASALGIPKKQTEKGVPYYKVERTGKKIVVAAAVGHLFTLTQEKKGSGWPIFNLKWQPNYKVKGNEWSKKYYSLLSKLCKNASEFIIATDYDVEGEVIGLNILRFICKQKDAKRMKFSTLTKEELENSYKNLMKSIDWGQAIAGETRHYLDWFYGINLSRALMEAIKKAGSFRIMSIGRVQGPALHLVVEKERKIKAFKPQPYWQVFVLIEGVELKHNKDITNKKELDKFKELKGKIGKVETKTIEQNISPPAPFDLTSLQTEAYKFFGISPSQTLRIAQQLYLAGIISYPRTSSQKIPPNIQPKKILEKLKATYKEVSLVTRDKPVEGKKTDPAHPSIYPTGEKAKLYGDQAKIYDLIVRRFISCFCPDAIIEDKRISFKINNLIFTAKALQVKEKGWLQVYKAKLKETKIKDLNGEYEVEKVKIEEKETQPPRRYTPASLISELAKRNLGTKATRALIIETLYNREYIKGKSIEATSLGISLIETLEKNSPIIIDEDLTRKFEEETEQIQMAKKNLESKEKKVINEAKDIIEKISHQFKKKEGKIGKALIKANNYMREQKREENTLNACPVCGKGKLRILFNRKFRRYFIACSAYPKCKTTFSLPPGLIKPTGKICDKCGFPKLLRIMKGKRPWEFCFNPECESRKEKSK